VLGLAGIPTGVVTAISAVVALLPILAADVGLAGASAPVAGVKAMSPGDARAYIKAALAK